MCQRSQVLAPVCCELGGPAKRPAGNNRWQPNNRPPARSLAFHFHSQLAGRARSCALPNDRSPIYHVLCSAARHLLTAKRHLPKASELAVRRQRVCCHRRRRCCCRRRRLLAGALGRDLRLLAKAPSPSLWPLTHRLAAEGAEGAHLQAAPAKESQSV